MGAEPPRARNGAPFARGALFGPAALAPHPPPPRRPRALARAARGRPPAGGGGGRSGGRGLPWGDGGLDPPALGAAAVLFPGGWPGGAGGPPGGGGGSPGRHSPRL